jgi:hypothetical protein
LPRIAMRPKRLPWKDTDLFDWRVRRPGAVLYPSIRSNSTPTARIRTTIPANVSKISIIAFSRCPVQQMNVRSKSIATSQSAF